MNLTIEAKDLLPGMLIGFLKVRRVTQVKRVTNGDIYYHYSTLGFAGKSVRATAKTKITVQIKVK